MLMSSVPGMDPGTLQESKVRSPEGTEPWVCGQGRKKAVAPLQRFPPRTLKITTGIVLIHVSACRPLKAESPLLQYLSGQGPTRGPPTWTFWKFKHY